MRQTWFCLLIIAAVLWAVPVIACEMLNESQEIDRLLTLVEHSHMQFIRNGSVYEGSAARKHLEQKLQFADGRITTAEQFIHYLASKSSITGKPYLVRFPDGKEMDAEAWLTEQLFTIESSECIQNERAR